MYEPLVLASPPPAHPFGSGFGRDLRPITAIGPGYGVACVVGWYVFAFERGHWEERAAHGATHVVDSRTVCIRRYAADGTLEKRDVEVAAWRGNYILDAVVSAGILGDRSERGWGPMNVRLHPAYDAGRLLRSSRTLRIYERTLVGEHVDYCAVRRNLTFHAATAAEAVQGLRVKITARIDAKGAKR